MKNLLRSLMIIDLVGLMSSTMGCLSNDASMTNPPGQAANQEFTQPKTGSEPGTKPSPEGLSALRTIREGFMHPAAIAAESVIGSAILVGAASKLAYHLGIPAAFKAKVDSLDGTHLLAWFFQTPNRVEQVFQSWCGALTGPNKALVDTLLESQAGCEKAKILFRQTKSNQDKIFALELSYRVEQVLDANDTNREYFLGLDTPKAKYVLSLHSVRYDKFMAQALEKRQEILNIADIDNRNNAIDGLPEL